MVTNSLHYFYPSQYWYFNICFILLWVSALYMELVYPVKIRRILMKLVCIHSFFLFVLKINASSTGKLAHLTPPFACHGYLLAFIPLLWSGVACGAQCFRWFFSRYCCPWCFTFTLCFYLRKTLPFFCPFFSPFESVRYCRSLASLVEQVREGWQKGHWSCGSASAAGGQCGFSSWDMDFAMVMLCSRCSSRTTFSVSHP